MIFAIAYLLCLTLINIQSAAFAEQYERGVWWSMYGDEQGQGPVVASYLVTNLKDYAERDYFGTHDPYHLPRLGFFLGMYHGGILSPQAGQLRPDVVADNILSQDASETYHLLISLQEIFKQETNQ